MIVICDALCKAHSHEQFNSGFIFGFRLAYPEEKILFYGDASHIEAVKNIFGIRNVIIDNIEYIPIQFQLKNSFTAFIQFYFLFRRILSDLITLGEDRLFLLASNSPIRYILKRLKQNRKFNNIRFSLVCHGDWEELPGKRPEMIELPLRKVTQPSLIAKVQKVTIANFSHKVRGGLERIGGWGKRLFQLVENKCQGLFNSFFPFKKILLWRHSKDFKYIFLSPHIVNNVAQYIDVSKFDFHTVVLPTIFKEPTPQPHNKSVKFGIIGYGYSGMLYKLLTALSLKKLTNPYEIRIIGMDNRAAEGFPCVTCQSPGKPLPREDMEKSIEDIDVSLILYDKTLHRFGCSGSILEAMSYMKPVVHLENDCVNIFNTKDNPIGICCNSPEGMADVMAKIINNYTEYRSIFQEYRDNILKLRRQIDIRNNTSRLRASFTW